MHGREKSDPAIVAMKPANNAASAAAELVERRAGAEGNARQQGTRRTQTRTRVTQALDRVRQAARLRKKERFTALLHHVSVDTLQTAFYALKRKAAPGVDGMTWQEYDRNTRQALSFGLRPYTIVFIEEPIGHNLAAGRIFRRRTDGRGRWRSLPWKTRLSRVPPSWC